VTLDIRQTEERYDGDEFEALDDVGRSTGKYRFFHARPQPRGVPIFMTRELCEFSGGPLHGQRTRVTGEPPVFRVPHPMLPSWDKTPPPPAGRYERTSLYTMDNWARVYQWQADRRRA
jgi:hypothetical protein